MAYTIYVSPLFDLTKLSNFADDNFALTWHTSKQVAIIEMQTKLKVITTWLKESGLKDYEEKMNSACFIKKTPTQLRSL